MKKITAIVRQEKLEVLKDALFAADVRGMTINQVQGCGAQHGWKEYVRGNELLVNTIPKVQFTLICADEHVDGIVEFMEDLILLLDFVSHHVGMVLVTE